MNTKEIRQWGEEVGGKYPMAYRMVGGIEPEERHNRESVHNDNFGLAILQIQATLEVAAQIAQLLSKLNELSPNGLLDVKIEPNPEA